VPFTWDGLDANNAAAKPGVYKIQATGYIDGKNTTLDTDIKSQVDSVSMGSGGNGVKVNLTGLGSVDFNQVKQIL
jgi:flagellar basal-body rod modification protein FlgD